MHYPNIFDRQVPKNKTSISIEPSLSSAIIRLFQFFGVSPIRSSRLNGTHKMSRSTPRNNQISIVAHRLWCCIYLISIIYCMFIQHFYYGTSIHDLETFLYVDSYILKVVNLVLILSGSHQRDDNLCEKIAAFDKRLLAYVVEAKRDESLLSHGRYRALMRRGVGAIMVLLIVSTLLEVWYNNFQFMLWAISCLVYVLPNITFALCHLQYVAKLQLLRWRSQQINISLKQILSADDDVNVKNRWFVGVSSAKSYSVNTSLNEIRLLHLELNSLGKVLSKAFEYVLVTFFVTSVILVTIATFTIYIVIYNWDRNFKYILTIYPVMWGAIYMGQVVLFLYLNDRLNQEVIFV